MRITCIDSAEVESGASIVQETLDERQEALSEGQRRYSSHN